MFIPSLLMDVPNECQLSRHCSLPRVCLQRGFSLLEMLLVLGIVGVLSALALPNYQRFMAQREVDSVARELTQAIELARVRAQTYGQTIKICPTSLASLHQSLSACENTLLDTTPWRAWIVVQVNDNAVVQVLLRSRPVPHSVVLSGNANKGRTFNASGRSVTGFTMTVQGRAVQDVVRTIVLAPSGRLVLELKRSVISVKQKGFSLLEVLVAMLIAAIGIAWVMSVHAKSLRQVVDHTQFNQAQWIINNTVYRIQVLSDEQQLNAQREQLITLMTHQAVESGLHHAQLFIINEDVGFRVQLQWQAHNERDTLVRQSCEASSVGQHCLAAWVVL